MNKNKTKEELLADYKKSNKDRKAKLMARAGYKTESGYLKSLGVGTSKTVSKKSASTTKVAGKKKETIHNVFIMDDSGSMSGGKYKNGVKGIQELVKSIQKDTLTNNTISIIDLNRGIQFWMTDPNGVEYKEHGDLGNTPLYRTIGMVIKNILMDYKKGERVLLNIITDGQDTEGYGEYYNLRKTIKDVQKDNNFTITFVGTDSDVKHIQDNLNVDASNTLVHDNTAIGIGIAFMTTNNARVSYSSNVSHGLNVSKGFYKSVGKLED